MLIEHIVLINANSVLVTLITQLFEIKTTDHLQFRICLLSIPLLHFKIHLKMRSKYLIPYDVGIFKNKLQGFSGFFSIST